MTDLEKAARMALEWIDAQPEPRMLGALRAITALRQALEQPAQQEPVGYVYSVHGERTKNACIKSDVPNGTPLCILPQRKRVPLPTGEYEAGWNSALEMAAFKLQNDFKQAFGADTLASIAVYIKGLKK